MSKQFSDKNLQTNLLEMKDWKSHFTNGTKGMPKTDPRILGYVENVLKKAYDNNEEKVNNNPIAPWLVKVVVEIGPENINTEKINRIKSVIEYVKKTGNVANMPKMDLTQASDFAKEKLDKFAEKEKQAQQEKPKDGEGGEEEEVQKKELTPLQKAIYFQRKGKKIAPEIKDELDGKVERVWTCTDGSGRFWVKVIDNSWLSKSCSAGKQWGIQCQPTTFGNANYINYQLLGPPKGQTSPITTLIGMGILKSKGSVGEVKQVGNVQPGSQEYLGYRDLDVMFVEFLSFAPEAKGIKYFGDYHGQIVLDPYDSLHGGGIGFLFHLSQEKPDLFKKLANHRPDMIEANSSIIEKLFPNFEELMNVNIEELAQKDPEAFLMRIEHYLERYGEEAKALLNKLNIEDISKKNPELIQNILPDLTGIIPEDKLNSIIKNLDLTNYIYNNKLSAYEWFRKLSVNNNQNLLKNVVQKYSQAILSANGGGAKGAISFLREMEKPKLSKHANAEKDLDTGKYYAEREVNVKDGNGNDVRDANGNIIKRTERFEIPDNLLIMSQKERRDFINKNKEEIRNSIKSDERGKDITFLRLMFSQSNNQDIERNMKSERDEFIKYYDEKFRLGEVKKVQHPTKNEIIETKYIPGEFELFSIVNPKGVITTSEENVGDWEPRKKVYYPIGVENTKKNTVNIIKHYHNVNTTDVVEKIKRKYPNRLTKEILTTELKKVEPKLKYYSVKDYIKTLLYSGEKEESALQYFVENFNPERLNLNNSEGYSGFLNAIYTTFTHGLFYETLEKFKPKILQLGEQGKILYNEYIKGLQIKEYLVKPGDMVMFMEDDDMTYYMGDYDRRTKRVRPVKWDANLNKEVIDKTPAFLTYKRNYKVLDVGDYAGSKNGKVLIKDEGYYETGLGNDGKTLVAINHEPPTERWFNSNLFNIKSVNITKKIDENIFRELVKDRIKMIAENKKKTIAYTGIVLDRRSREKLYDWVKQMVKAKKLPIMKDWTESSDHITINPGKSQDESLIGKQVEVKVLQYAFDEKIAAVSIVVIVNGEEIEFSKEKPHITIAYDESQGARPVMSNNLTNWRPVPKSFVLSGTIMES